MISKFRSTAVAMVAALGLSTAAGCHLADMPSWELPKPPVPDIAPLRKERKNDVVKDFDDRRNVAQFLSAETSWRQGDHKRCRESLEKVLERDPNHRGALLLSADLALETDHPQEAVELLRRAAALDSQDAEIAYRLGLALETVGETADAVPYLRRAAQADPNNPQYADALSEVEQQLDPANQTASTGVEPQRLDQPSEAELVVAAAPAPRSELDRDPEMAAALADWEANRVVECSTRLAKILNHDPDHVEGNILQAEIELNGGQTAAALKRMDRLVLGHPRNFQVRQACGLVNEAAGNVEKANLFFREAESLAEADALVTVAYQEPMAVDGTIDTTDSVGAEGAVALASDVLTPPVVPNLEGPSNSSLPQDPAKLLDDGQAALEAGRIPDARRSLKAAVTRAKNDPHTAVTAAITALKLEQPELALELSTSGVGMFPRSAELHRIRGMSAYRIGKFGEAETSLRQSLNLDNSQALSYFLLGSAQNRLGKTEEAQRNLREAARLDSRYAQRK